MISFTYQAPIVESWKRARKRGKRHFTDPEHASAMLIHRAAAMLARPAGWTLDGVYEVAVIYARHGGHARDGDRVQSLVIDALKGCAWKDDSDARVTLTHCARLWGPSGTVARDSRTLWLHEMMTGHRPAPLRDGHTLVTVTRIGDGAKIRAKR